MRVAVLMGGMSAEREVSLETGGAIAAALRELGHEVVEVDVDPHLARKLEAAAPQAAFMALHGRAGRTERSRERWRLCASPTPGAACWQAR